VVASFIDGKFSISQTIQTKAFFWSLYIVERYNLLAAMEYIYQYSKGNTALNAQKESSCYIVHGW
jgi:hypothetical protein